MLDSLVRAVLWLGYRVLRISWLFHRPQLVGSCVAVWHRKRLLLIRNSYKSGETLPGGGIHRGESPREAARRELAEEVGLEVPPEQLEFAVEIDYVGRKADDHVHFFELHLASEPTLSIDRREVIWAGFCPSTQLAERPLIGCIRAYIEQREESR